MSAAVDHDTIRAELARARARTLALLDLPPADQVAQHSPLMSPPVWDLAHIGSYEELWLLRALDGRRPIDPSLDDLYDAFRHPRSDRPALPLLGPDEARTYLEQVRAAALELLDRLDLTGGPVEHEEPPSAEALRREGYAYGLVLQHEHQHDETLLATRQLMGERAAPPPGSRAWPSTAPTSPPPSPEVRFAGGATTIGSEDPWTYDNERPVHAVELDAFWIDAAPTTNADWQAFMADDGYDTAGLWSEVGWSWRQTEELEHPAFWRHADGGWERLRFGSWAPVEPTEPVVHICFHEAEAFARWAGKRLPTEHEWEHTATVGPGGAKRRFPWGDDDPTTEHANLGQRHDGPAPVGALPMGASPAGVHQLIGDVWEWTSSDFLPWPGYRSFPYPEYSQVFFGGDYKVLRGGSWATDPVAIRGTFRNWDHPIRRQIFAGVRLARDDA